MYIGRVDCGRHDRAGWTVSVSASTIFRPTNVGYTVPDTDGNASSLPLLHPPLFTDLRGWHGASRGGKWRLHGSCTESLRVRGVLSSFRGLAVAPSRKWVAFLSPKNSESEQRRQLQQQYVSNPAKLAGVPGHPQATGAT